ncbi:hypothetical protein [Sodalis sp. RH22]|uniref:hypothetical protein n=1 Tax=unclassified Sodalis (in: enterobacteria) TaxID=2636512 RepID=UPI0039B6ADF8
MLLNASLHINGELKKASGIMKYFSPGNILALLLMLNAGSECNYPVIGGVGVFPRARGGRFKRRWTPGRYDNSEYGRETG